MDGLQIIQWLTAIGALSGYVALGWTIWTAWGTRARTRDELLSADYRRSGRTIGHVRVRFHGASSHTAYDVEIAVRRPVGAKVSLWDQSRDAAGAPTGRPVEFHRQIVSTLVESLSKPHVWTEVVVSDPEGSGPISLRFTVRDRATRKTMIRKTLTLMAS